VHAAVIESVMEEEVQLRLVPRFREEEEEEEGLAGEAEALSRKRADLIGYRIYSQ